MAPEAVSVGDTLASPSNTTYATTDVDGTGSAKFDVWTKEQNTSLGCGQDTPCSLVAVPILGREAKLETLLQRRADLNLAPNDTLAVGDGANDIPMIVAAGLGVAFHGKPKVKEAAAASIDHGDLTALLYAQGYKREEFVESE